MIPTKLSDRNIGRAILKKLRFDLSTTKIQIIGITQDTANEQDKEWIKATLLNFTPIKSRRNYRIRRGLLQVSSFARNADKAEDMEWDRPWTLSGLVDESIEQKSISVEDENGLVIGAITFGESSTVYIPEDDLVKPKLGRNLEPGGIHAVVSTFNFMASLC